MLHSALFSVSQSLWADTGSSERFLQHDDSLWHVDMVLDSVQPWAKVNHLL